MSGGYGDRLSPEELIAQTEPLLYLQARERTTPDNVEDAVQEARITMWEVATAKPDAPAVYVRVAAKQRITEYATRGKATGAESMRGKSRPSFEASLDDPDFTLPMLLEAVGLLDDVQNAHLEGEVAQALDALTPAQRRYVELRFWQGADRARLKEEFGYDPSALWRAAKPRLAARLEHLVAA